MKKRIVSILLVLLLCITAIIPAFAADSLPRLVDDAELLTDSEEDTLLSLLDEISERQKTDIVVVTVSSIGGKSPMEYADDFYDYNGYGFGDTKDGILLLISMEDRDWYISTTGFGITAITDAGREYISESFLYDLQNGDYAEAFTVFAEQCDDFITQAKNGNPYDVGNLPKEPFGIVTHLIISLIAGFIVSLIVTGVMKGQLKTVRRKAAAENYIKSGSMKISESREFFLYAHLDRRKKQKSSSNSSGGSKTHTSSSGTTHGGGGGKF